MTTENCSNLTITLQTREPRYAIPLSGFQLASSSDSNDLNNIVNELLHKSNSNYQKVSFDFLINDEYLTSTLDEFIKEKQLTQEKILVEYIPRCQPPVPSSQINTSDLISSIRAAKDFLLIGLYDDTLQIWKIGGSEPQLVQTYNDKIKCVDWVNLNDEYGTFVSGSFDQRLALWHWNRSSNTIKQLASLVGHSKVVFSCATSPCGQFIASGSWDAMLKIWSSKINEANGECVDNNNSSKPPVKVPIVTLAGHREVISRIHWITNGASETHTENSFSTASSHLLTSSWDHTVRLWDVNTGQETQCLQQGPGIQDMDVAGEGGRYVLTASADNRVRLFDLRAKQNYLTHQGFQDHTGWLSSIAWSPGYKNNSIGDTSISPLFVTGSIDCTVKMWDLRKLNCCLYNIHGFDAMVTDVEWFKVEEDKREYIASSSAAGEVKLFTVGSNQ